MRMEKIPSQTRFMPTRHAVARLQERFYPGMSEERATQLLLQLAKAACPLKVSVNHSNLQQAGEA